MVLAPLSPILIVLVCGGLALVLTLLTLALINVLKQAPYIGGWLADKARALEQAATSALGKAFSGVEHLVGAALHALARLIDNTYGLIHEMAHALNDVASLVGSQLYSVSGLRALVHRLEKVWHGIEHGVRSLTKRFHGIEARVKALERKIARGIGHDLRIHIRALEKWERAAKAQLEADAKAITQTIPAEIANLRQWLGIKSGINWREWASGLVLAGLTALGFSGLVSRCSPLKNNPNPCAWWNDLAGLLGLATIAIEAANFEELVRQAQSLEEEVAGAIKTLWGLD